MPPVGLDELLAPEVIRDPYPFFARLRETDPVHWNATYELWVLTRYDDIVEIFRDHKTFSSHINAVPAIFDAGIPPVSLDPP